LIVMIAAAAGCYSPDLPAAPFLCGAADPKCPDGYACTDDGNGRMVCVVPNGTIPDAPTDGSHCANDSMLEPNEDIMHAFQTNVDTNRKMLTFAGLAICPMGDKDTYAVQISVALENLEAIVEYDAGGAALQASILNVGGSPIGNGSPSGANMIRAYTPNLPANTYYVQVYGPASGTSTTNNYKLTLNVTGP
jgi:hypothetical protein